MTTFTEGTFDLPIFAAVKTDERHSPSGPETVRQNSKQISQIAHFSVYQDPQRLE